MPRARETGGFRPAPEGGESHTRGRSLRGLVSAARLAPKERSQHPRRGLRPLLNRHMANPRQDHPALIGHRAVALAPQQQQQQHRRAALLAAHARKTVWRHQYELGDAWQLGRGEAPGDPSSHGGADHRRLPNPKPIHQRRGHGRATIVGLVAGRVGPGQAKDRQIERSNAEAVLQ